MYYMYMSCGRSFLRYVDQSRYRLDGWYEICFCTVTVFVHIMLMVMKKVGQLTRCLLLSICLNLVVNYNKILAFGKLNVVQRLQPI